MQLASTPRNIAWFVFAATPLVLLTGTFLSHDVMPKVILVLVGAAALLFLLPLWSGGLSALWSSRRGRWFCGLAAAQALLLGASTLFSTQPLVSFAGSTWRRFGMVEQLATLVVACCIAASTRDSTRILWRAVSGCGGIAALYGISQYFGFDPFLNRHLYAPDYFGGVIRPPATMGHAIYFAAYLAPVGLIAAWQAIEEQQMVWRLAHAVAAVLTPLAILLSGSRGALLGWAGGALVLVWFRRPSRTAAVFGTGAVLTVAALVAFSPMGENLRNRIIQWREDPGSVRLEMWRESPALIAKAPWLGSGPETFAAAFRQVESAAFYRAYPDFVNETPHNAFIDAACAEGLPGALILLAVFALVLSGKGSPGLRAAMTGMLICGLFASFSLITGMYLWVIAGISATEERSAKSAQKITRPKTVLASLGSAAGIAFLTVAILLGVQDAAYADLGRAVDARDLSQAKLDLQRATSFGVGMPGYELWASQEMSKLKAWREAGDAAALAESRGEDPADAAYQASLLQVINGNAAQAEAKARDSIERAPNWYKPHLLRAQLFQAMGRTAEAAQEARRSIDLGWKGK